MKSGHSGSSRCRQAAPAFGFKGEIPICIGMTAF
jgi:hypothetical protein